MKLCLILILASLATCQSVKSKLNKINFNIKKYFQDHSDLFDMDLNIDVAFDDYAKMFKKMYFHPGEMENRKNIFMQNVKKIFRHNKDKNCSFEMDINQFSDMDFEEFRNKHLNRNLIKEITDDFGMDFTELPRRRLRQRKLNGRNHKIDQRRLQKIKRKVSWKHHCTGIKDQKSCAACYAFSTVAGYEVERSRHSGKKESLSEQSMVDCVRTNRGCKAGSPARTINYIYSKGISKTAVYPFVSKQQTCKTAFMRSPHLVRDNLDYDYLDYGILSVVEALQNGPIILVQTANDAFRSYKKGVFDDTECTEELDHSTLAVGYDLDAPVPYIEVKNSWGAGWGDNGWFKIKIGELSNSNGGLCLMADHEYNMKIYFSEY